MFQFHSGSIKLQDFIDLANAATKFQFHSGSIKLRHDKR